MFGSLNLAQIPGTRSVWGGSWIGLNSPTSQSTQAAIIKFGP